LDRNSKFKSLRPVNGRRIQERGRRDFRDTFFVGGALNRMAPQRMRLS
jgi:hypothetical protein